jgi:hypothetical protein
LTFKPICFDIPLMHSHDRSCGTNPKDKAKRALPNRMDGNARMEQLLKNAASVTIAAHGPEAHPAGRRRIEKNRRPKPTTSNCPASTEAMTDQVISLGPARPHCHTPFG